MQITITINSCLDCRHLDHSGSFTPGGALPVCGHRGAVYGSHASVPAGATVKDVMIQHGMDEESAARYERPTMRDNEGHLLERLLSEGEEEWILLADSTYKPGDCLHWVHRVPFVREPSIPDWCPLKNGQGY